MKTFSIKSHKKIYDVNSSAVKRYTWIVLTQLVISLTQHKELFSIKSYAKRTNVN